MSCPYTIIKSFIKHIDAPAAGSVQIASDTNIEMNIEVDYASLQDGTYSSDLTVHICQSVDSTTIVGNIDLTYTTIVAFADSVSQSERESMLSADIPQSIYNKVRHIVWEQSEKAGLTPIMLPYYLFTSQVGRGELNYRALIMELAGNEQFSGFMEVYHTYCDNPYSYTDSPLYRHCLRLFTPKEYCHPTFADCHESCWDMFLQLLLVNATAEYKLVQTEGTAPELVFSYLSLKEVAASTLTPEEFKSLMLCLLTDAFALVLPQIIGNRVDQRYSKQITDYQTLSREDIMRLYGCDNNSPKQKCEVVNLLYSRLCDYYLQTN